ncbi:recombinase family protein [Glutamicibacter protophormiae]|uniref:recombinase family protein n=1 Tax=Glutamicibacter protophormiae TaxID=37930 RepID=UPI0033168865
MTTSDWLGRSTQKMLELTQEPREHNIGLHLLNLGGGDANTKTPMGVMVFTVMAALAQMELEIKCERITDSVNKRRTIGGDLGRPTPHLHRIPDLH